MSQTTFQYYGLTVPTTKEAFRNRFCCKYASDPNYLAPTPAEVKALIAYANWTLCDVARITGISFDIENGLTVVRGWVSESEQSKNDSSEISYPAWRLLLLYAGIVEINEEFLIN